MKEVIDLQGNVVQVAIDTPVRTKTVIEDGKSISKHYLLTQAQLDDLAAGVAAHEAEETSRAALAEIIRLESQVTERRKREAILGTDNGWLANQESLIAAERAKLT